MSLAELEALAKNAGLTDLRRDRVLKAASITLVPPPPPPKKKKPKPKRRLTLFGTGKYRNLPKALQPIYSDVVIALVKDARGTYYAYLRHPCGCRRWVESTRVTRAYASNEAVRLGRKPCPNHGDPPCDE